MQRESATNASVAVPTKNELSAEDVRQIVASQNQDLKESNLNESEKIQKYYNYNGPYVM